LKQKKSISVNIESKTKLKMALYSILYTSKSNAGGSDSEIFKIIEKAQIKNASLGLTGMLLYIEDSFLQVIEGEEENVKELIDVIRHDPRHYHFNVILQGRVKERSFEKWRMGLKIFTSQDLMDVKMINKDNDFDLIDTLNQNGNITMELMRYFYLNGEVDFKKFWSSNNQIEKPKE